MKTQEQIEIQLAKLEEILTETNKDLQVCSTDYFLIKLEAKKNQVMNDISILKWILKNENIQAN